MIRCPEQIHIEFDKLEKYVHKFNEKNYINLEVARMKSPDNFGRDSTVYINTLVDVDDNPATDGPTTEEPVPAFVQEPGAPAKHTKKTKKTVQQNIPF